MIEQKFFTLKAYPRGVHLITHYIENYINNEIEIENGMVNLFLQHTSASLALNENFDVSVRKDVESFLEYLIPDCWKKFSHTLEGCDDMPAHMKSIMIGSSLNIPLSKGKLALGRWQGIYLLEHRDYGGERSMVMTVIGE